MALIDFPIIYVPNPTQGKPLFFGKIFVGIPDLDPEDGNGNPINSKQLRIVQEDGTKIDVAQPFVLSAGGVPIYNGATVRLDVDGNYSLKILDKNNVQTYYIHNVFEGQPVTVDDLINDISQAYEFPTLNNAVEFDELIEGKVCHIKERTTGSGGSAIADAVLASSVTPNTIDIVLCTGVNTQALVYRLDDEDIDINMLGANTTDDIAPILIRLAVLGKTAVISDAYKCSTITGITSLKIKMNGGKIDNFNDASDDLFLDIPDLVITGCGKFGDNNAYLENIDHITNSAMLENRVVEGDLLFNGKGITTGLFLQDANGTTTPDATVTFQHIEGKNFLTYGIAFRGTAIQDGNSALVHHVKMHSGAGRAIQFGDNSNGWRSVTVTDCPRISDISSTGSAEAKGIIIYGRDATIDGNTVQRIKNEAVSGGEGIYTKCTFATITNNKLRDAGSSSDGCITLKGSPYFTDEFYNDAGDWDIVTGNTIELTLISHDSKGIGIFDSNVICTGNTLKDLRPTRNTLTYSEAISIGGSAAVSNVICSDNISNGWNTFCGDFDETGKGRAQFCDNITIKNNTAVNMLGGTAVSFRPDCVITGATFDFDAATKTITIQGGELQNREFDLNIYPVGSTLDCALTVSNNGVLTVTAIGRYVLTVAEVLVDETIVDAHFTRVEVFNLKITGNTFQGTTRGIRNFGNKMASMLLDSNTYMDMTNAYRLDQTGGIGELTIGANESYINVTTTYFTTPVADQWFKGVLVKSDVSGVNGSAGTLTADIGRAAVDIAYTNLSNTIR